MIAPTICQTEPSRLHDRLPVRPRNVGQEYQSDYIRSHDFVGVVDEVQGESF